MTRTNASPDPAEGSPVLRERIARHGRTLSRTERIVAEYLATLAPSELPFVNADAIAEATGTSDASVIRTARRLGFSGLPELKRLATRPHATVTPPRERVVRRLAALGTDLGPATARIFDAAHELLHETAAVLDLEALDTAIGTISAADTVWCVGMGTSAAPALHLSDLLSRAGTRTRWLHETGFDLANRLLDLRDGDAVVLVHAARPMPDVHALVTLAGERGVPLILVCGTQLADRYGDEVTAVLGAVGSASRMASWNTGAFVLAEILGLMVEGAQETAALETRDRLVDLRARFGHAPR
ncbi:MurR/RpiR family transcriptional regulator [Streptosporangium sp. NPDC002524]|uniref:MurR/RpiR family transcriptional regulator n=1 Tax=Streptosporangium sp. NPDC002524 TaxID=3154537 RepID=UPI00331F9A8C